MPGNADRSDPAAANGHHHGHPQTQNLVAVLDGLERRLATQPVIEQAKGIVMLLYGVDTEAAFAVLRRSSMNRNVKLHSVASDVVAAASGAHPARFDGLRTFLQSEITR